MTSAVKQRFSHLMNLVVFPHKLLVYITVKHDCDVQSCSLCRNANVALIVCAQTTVMFPLKLLDLTILIVTQPALCRTWSEIRQTYFLMIGLIYFYSRYLIEIKMIPNKNKPLKEKKMKMN